MTDDIDESCWVPEGEPVLTPEREAKGDLAIHRNDYGEVQEAKLMVKSTLVWLYDHDHIGAQQFDDGHVYQAWRAQYRVAHGFEKAVAEGNGEATGDKLRAYGYVLIMRCMSRYDLSALDHMLAPFTEWNASRNALAYARALFALSGVLPAIRDQINALEALELEAREALVAERLQKLLDIVRHKD